MRAHRIVLPVALLVVVAGCSGIVPSGEQPDRHYFVLEATRSGASRTPAEGAVLQIRPLLISPRYQGRDLVYRMDEGKWEADYYNVFFLPPAMMLTEVGTNWLRESSLFESVVNPLSYARPTHMLEGNVVAFYGDFRSAEGPAAVLEIQALLLTEKDGSPVIAFQRNFGKRVPLEDRSVEGLVEGWNRAFAEILTELEAAIAETDLTVASGEAPAEETR
jgi:cholesterol transport system auxiliary component